MSTKKTVSFEKSLADLSQIVKELEQGELPLDKALSHFETGMLLARSCQKTLEEAELKVQKLCDTTLEPFEPKDE